MQVHQDLIACTRTAQMTIHGRLTSTVNEAHETVTGCYTSVTQSLDSFHLMSEGEPKPKSKRPGSKSMLFFYYQSQKQNHQNSFHRIDTAFKQQRLKAWQPILTPKTVIPTFLIIGAIFIPIGIGLYIASDQVSTLFV